MVREIHIPQNTINQELQVVLNIIGVQREARSKKVQLYVHQQVLKEVLITDLLRLKAEVLQVIIVQHKVRQEAIEHRQVLRQKHRQIIVEVQVIL